MIATLGRIALTLGRRTSRGWSGCACRRRRRPRGRAGCAGVACARTPERRRHRVRRPPSRRGNRLRRPRTPDGRKTRQFRIPADVLPVDVEVKRAVALWGAATTPEEQSAAVDKLPRSLPSCWGCTTSPSWRKRSQRSTALLPTANDPRLTEAITRQRSRSRAGPGGAPGAPAGGPRVPPEQREALVAAGVRWRALHGARAGCVLAAPLDLRASYRAAVRKAGIGRSSRCRAACGQGCPGGRGGREFVGLTAASGGDAAHPVTAHHCRCWIAGPPPTIPLPSVIVYRP